MTTFKVSLHTIDDVNNFVKIVTACPYDVDLTSGRYVVDAKSIMGIFSLDLSKPIDINIHSDNAEEVVKALQPYKA